MSLSKIPAVILCGGLGTRLRATIGDSPKVLASVAGRPFLAYLLEYLHSQGVRKVILCTGYHGWEVEAHCSERSSQELQPIISQEDAPLGTGGAIKRAERFIEADTFLVMNGDSLLVADLSHLLEFHRSRRASISLALAAVPATDRYGSVGLGPEGIVTAFNEKRQGTMGIINAGIYLMNRELLDSIPDARAVSLEHEVFPAFVGRGLYGLVFDGPFIDIGTADSYESAQRTVPAMFTRSHDAAVRKLAGAHPGSPES